MRYLFILLFLVSCQNKTKISTKKTSVSTCSDTMKYTDLILKSINLPELQQYYYTAQDTFNKKELIILNNNKYLKYIKESNKFNNQIKLFNLDKITQQGIKDYLEFREIKIKKDTANLYYRYDIQGVIIETSYFLKDCKWHLIKSDVWEH